MGSRRKQKTEKSMIQNLYWKQVFRSPKTKIGLMVVIIFALAAIFAPVLAPHDPLISWDDVFYQDFSGAAGIH